MAEQNKQNSGKGTNQVASHEQKRKTLGQAINDTRVELRKVHWPKKTELQKYTVVVIATVAFFSVAIYAIDSGLGFVISKLVVR